VIKSMRMKGAGHAASKAEMRGAYIILVGKSEGKAHLEDLDVDRRIILE